MDFFKAFMCASFMLQFVYAAERGTDCVTPNNEKAICSPVKLCAVILNAILTKNASVVEFAQQSQCGFDSEPLVCCGSIGYSVSGPIFGVSDRNAEIKDIIRPFQHNLLPNASVCGVERTEHRIYGGKHTDLDEFPWTALLRYKDHVGEDAGFRCGATLLNERYVITAAHCLFDKGLHVVSVRLGEWRISTDPDCLGQKEFEECADPVVDIDVENTVTHPLYYKWDHTNDISLVRLKRSIEYTDFIRPICLPSSTPPPIKMGTKMVVVGWGETGKRELSDVKLKVQVPFVPLEICVQRIRRRTPITENHICAGGVYGKDSCHGDSGGPLMRMVEDESGLPQWYLEGIVSWGVICGVKDFPAVHTRVSKYVEWIGNSLKP